MRFLVRMTFWLGVVLVLLPSFSDAPAHKPAAEEQPAVTVSAVDAVMFAGAAASDMRGFCERRPEACEIGSQVAAMIGHRAQAGAQILYGFIAEQIAQHHGEAAAGGSGEAGAVKAAIGAISGALGARAAAPANAVPGTESQNTLTPSDLEAGWRGPAGGDKSPARGA